MGLFDKMNDFFKGENKQVERVIDNINQDPEKLEMQKLLARIEDTDGRKFLSEVSDNMTCELSDIEDKQYQEFAVEVTGDGVTIKNQDKRKSLHDYMQIIKNTSQEKTQQEKTPQEKTPQEKTPQEKETNATQQHYEKGDESFKF